ncbi:MAG: hypothetical protein ACE5FE_07865 [Acidiferrobacterales bacterium]
METFFYIYMTAWGLACVVALAIYLWDRRSFYLSHREYWQFLAEPWKLVTFGIAWAGITLIAPYTGDPTWDYVDASFMSVLTFATAPWAVGALYKAARRELPLKQAYVAACVWMFSASWSYDLYLVLRDGDYPFTWFVNIAASSVLYVSAGLLWNLEWQPNRGVIFGFMRGGWPSPSVHSRLGRVVWVALPFMLIAAIAVLAFVLPNPFA